MNSAPSQPIFKPAPSKAEDDGVRDIKLLYGRTAGLLDLELFRWFLETCVKTRLDEQQMIALDTKKTPAERELAVQLRAVLAEIYNWTAEQRDSSRSFIQQNQA